MTCLLIGPDKEAPLLFPSLWHVPKENRVTSKIFRSKNVFWSKAFKFLLKISKLLSTAFFALRKGQLIEMQFIEIGLILHIFFNYFRRYKFRKYCLATVCVFKKRDPTSANFFLFFIKKYLRVTYLKSKIVCG